MCRRESLAIRQRVRLSFRLEERDCNRKIEREKGRSHGNKDVSDAMCEMV